MAEKKEVRIEDRYVRWFSDTDKKDIKLVGGKAANLGEMLHIGMPVPQGFSITSEAYSYFLKVTRLDEKIYSLLNNLDVEDTKELEETARKIREMIERAELPEDLKEEILEAYSVLCSDNIPENVSENVMNILKMSDYEFVAVRSSATAEDSSEASFAGQQETFLNIKGKTELIEAVKKCFASLFTARSIYYRIRKGFKHEQVLIAVIIQKMINSDKSGVIFSNDPVTRKENVVVEAVFGLGEGIVSGRIQPDHYSVSRELKILEKNIADKKIAITRNSAGKTETIKLVEDKSRQQVLSDSQIKRLASYALELEEHYKIPQDIEFAVDSNYIYIVQTRPITTLGKEMKKEKVSGNEILRGLAASPGIGSGIVKIILDLKDLNKIEKGDILVTKMTNPDMVVTMQKCSGIVTDEGGVTSHAAIVSREMGIPAIVGTQEATKKLRDGQVVTVDGFEGKVYEGELKEEKKIVIEPIVQTKTKIKIMVDLSNFAERASKTNCKEVGLLRLEGIIAESGKHPFYFLKSGDIKEYEKIIFSGISRIAEYFDNLWIRTSDIRSDEFRNLEGSAKIIEANPMLGMHGIRAGLKNKEILKAEIKAISELSRQGKKIGIMLPQIISADEVRKVREILEELNVNLSDNLRLGVMIETPAAVQIIEELCEEGISFISFGTNDLTQYTLAIDRGNEQVQFLYDEMNPAVLNQLKKVISVCKKYDVETSICGQAGSSKQMVEFLVKRGIDSISVNADKAREISEFVRELEEKGLRESELKEEQEEAEEIEAEAEEKEEEIEKERKVYRVICDNCGKEAEVPFKPKPGREVYCQDCYRKRREKKGLKDKNIDREMEKQEPEEIEEVEEKPAEGKEEKKEEWKDVAFGIDVFSSQESGEEKNEEEEQEIEEEAEEQEEVEEEKEEDEEEQEKEAEELIREEEEEREEMMREGEDEDKGLDIF